MRDVARHRPIRLASTDAGERTPNFKIADLPVLVVGVKHRLEVPVVITSEAFRDGSEPLSLCLGAFDARLRALDESASFLLGDRRGDVGDQFSRSIGANLLDPSIGDRDRGAGVLALLKEALIDAAESRQPRDLPDDDVLVLAGPDRLDELGELLATGIGS